MGLWRVSRVGRRESWGLRHDIRLMVMPWMAQDPAITRRHREYIELDEHISALLGPRYKLANHSQTYQTQSAHIWQIASYLGCRLCTRVSCSLGVTIILPLRRNDRFYKNAFAFSVMEDLKHYIS